MLCWKWSHHGKSLLSAVERGDSRLAEQVHVYVRKHHGEPSIAHTNAFVLLSDDRTVGYNVMCA